MLNKYHAAAILLSSLSISAHAIDHNTKELTPQAHKEQASKSSNMYAEKTGKHKKAKPNTKEMFTPLEKVTTKIDSSDPEAYDKSMKKIFAVLSPEDKNKMFKYIKQGMNAAGDTIKLKAKKGKLEDHEHKERLNLFLSLFDNKTPSQAIQEIESLSTQYEKSNQQKEPQTKCPEMIKNNKGKCPKE